MESVPEVPRGTKVKGSTGEPMSEVYSGIGRSHVKGSSQYVESRQLPPKDREMGMEGQHIITTRKNTTDRARARKPVSKRSNKPGSHARRSRVASYAMSDYSPTETSSSESDEHCTSDNDTECDLSKLVSAQHVRPNPDFGPKLPPFTGKESWEVWFNRFSAIAERRGWSKDRKLDEILPRIQGVAADFVFVQLPRSTLQSYRALTTELENRFRKIESAKSYAAKFSKRTQMSDESVETYAAELKRLYDRAHANRDKETRQEDLTRKFFDGLLDDQSRQVEYFKDPKTIDESVSLVVDYLETRQRSHIPSFNSDKRSKVRFAKNDNYQNSDEPMDNQQSSRASKSPATRFQKNNKVDNETNENAHKSNHAQVMSPPHGTNSSANNGAIMGTLEKILDIMVKQANAPPKVQNYGPPPNTLNTGPPHSGRNFGATNNTRNMGPYNGTRNSGSSPNSYNTNSSSGRGPRPNPGPYICYRCGEAGHFIRECPLTMTGQFSVSTHVSPSPSEGNVGSN